MMLTVRDLQLIEYLSEQGVATADQLVDRFFPSKNAFWIRAHRLTQEGYLEAKPLFTFADAVPSRLLPLAVKLRQAGKSVQSLKVYRLGEKFGSKESKFLRVTDPVLVQHQIGLNEIRSFLESILPNNGVLLTDPEVRLEESRFGSTEDVLIPDLVWRSNGKSVAFEFERNLKGKIRYFDRMSRYQSSKYDKVVYFCETEEIFDELLDRTEHFYKIGISLASKPNKVFSKSLGAKSLIEFLGIHNGTEI